MNIIILYIENILFDSVGCPINIFKLNEFYLCNDIENNMVMHTTPLEEIIFIKLLDPAYLFI